MHISCACSGHGGLATVLAGVRGELKAGVLAQALDTAGLLDDSLSEGLAALADTAQGVTQAGLALIEHDMLGTLIDALA